MEYLMDKVKINVKKSEWFVFKFIKWYKILSEFINVRCILFLKNDETDRREQLFEWEALPYGLN